LSHPLLCVSSFCAQTKSHWFFFFLCLLKYIVSNKNAGCLTYSKILISDVNQNYYRLEVYSNFSIRIFPLVTLHTGSTKLCSLLSTQNKICSSAQTFFFAGKINPYYNVPQVLFEIAIKLFYLNKRKDALSHCGRVTQICVFNTVKLGTSASSP